MDFQYILKEKYINDIININLDFLNHIDEKKKILHQIIFSKSLKLIDPYYKLKKNIDVNYYHEHSILYRYLIKDALKDYNITYKNIMDIDFNQMKKNIDDNIFRIINFRLWDKQFNYMILNFINKKSVSHRFTRRCFFNIQFIELEIIRKRNENIMKML